MRYKLCLVAAAILLAATLLSTQAVAKVNVVTTSTDLADIARAVGGDKVTVSSLMVGTQNPHTVEPRPSHVSRLSSADLFVRIGMDLDVWADGLVDAARNRDIRPGGKGYVDASSGIKKLEIPSGKVDGSHGDIHAFGNPHYWLDPQNAKIIARNVLEGLRRVAPANSDYFNARYASFSSKIDKKLDTWQAAMAPHRGKTVVTYHKSWIYLLRRVGLIDAGYVEPKPGIPPSPAHVRALVARMKKEDSGVILMEPFYSRKFPDAVARQTGAKVVIAPSSVGGEKGVSDYFSLIDTIIDRLSKAL